MKLKNEQGFSLIEVTIAITLFAFFVTAFLTSQGYNVQDSALSQEQITLQILCERKMNELYLNPPKFTNVTSNMKETKAFEDRDYSNYEWTLEIKKLTVPDFAQLFSGEKGSTTEEAQDSYDGKYFDNSQKLNRNATVEKIIFQELKRNIEKVLWQARITVTNKETKLNYSLSTFLTNYDEKIQINVSF